MAVRHSYPKLIASLVMAFCLFPNIVIQACRRQSEDERVSKTCGSAEAVREMNGLYWLLGTPTTANVLCAVQDGQFKQIKVLEPESRDPVLLQDLTTDQVILVERFSGRSARPTRASWFSPDGALLAQRGDWPQNTYSVMRTSQTQGLVTGFDFADVWNFNWSNVDQFLLGQPMEFARTLKSANPLLSLKNGSWLASIDGGYDLQRYTATVAKALVFDTQSGEFAPTETKIEDVNLKIECKNAFQFVMQSNSKAFLSCNPQYFGAVEDENVNIFEIELTVGGELRVRNLLSKRASEVQKMDLWGFDAKANRLFVAMKLTTAEDFNGVLSSAGWLSIEDSRWETEIRVAGPLQVLASGLFVFACQHDSQFCKQGELAIMNATTSEVKALRPDFVLPFLSFPMSIPTP